MARRRKTKKKKETPKKLSVNARVKQGLTPAVIQAAGEKVEKDFWAFFSVAIRNPNTRDSYTRSCFKFFDWCQERGITFKRLEPVHIACYLERISADMADSSVKNVLAGLRHLFDFMVVNQNVYYNPAASVKGPKVSSRGDGKTKEFTAREVETLFASIPADNLIGLRDRALIAVLVFSWMRISAALGMRVKDYTGSEFLINEKGGIWRRLPVHSEARPILDAYVKAGGLEKEPDSPLFRGTLGGKGKRQTLNAKPFTRTGALMMVKRRCAAAGLSPEMSNHSFRATGITEFIKNGGTLDDAQMIAGHADVRTTKGYDRSRRRVTQNMMERVFINVS